MTDEQIVLARRAVACEDWRWMPGMLAHAPDSGVEARVRNVDGEVLEVCLPDWYGVSWLAHRVVPDLTDPATLGCLLALVREAHGRRCYTQVCGGYWTVQNGDTEDAWGDHCSTEAEALVAALEAAP